MACVRIAAPAKINVHLRIVGRREDGFHDLESVFLQTAFGDSLVVREDGEDGGCVVNMRWDDGVLPAAGAPAVKDNLIVRAAEAFRRRTGYGAGLVIGVDKRVPPGSGMGGGSSDAASTLIALNSLSGAGLGAAELETLAASLGSDVPFFIRGGAAYVCGRGECLSPLETPPGLYLVLVNPGIPSPTAEAFARWDAVNAVSGGAPRREPDTAASMAASLAKPPREWPFRNDFLAAADERFGYGAILGRLRAAGAEFSGLSGSGSACFGVFTDETKARAAEFFLSKYHKLVFFSFPVAFGATSMLE